MVELMYKILCLLTSPIKWFWDNIPKYVKQKQHAKIVISFFISLLLMAIIAFDIIGLAYIIIMFANNHLLIASIISGIAILYWYVKQKHTTIRQEREQPVEETEEKDARNGYRDMRLIVFKTVQTIGEALGIRSPKMLTDIESVNKYYLNNGCVFYLFDIKKENINQKYTEEELEDSINVLKNTFMELWHKNAFPTVQMSTYTDNSGVILPPVIFVLLSDMGSYLELYVAFASPATVDFIKSSKQGQNATGNGYDKNDSHLL